MISKSIIEKSQKVSVPPPIVDQTRFSILFFIQVLVPMWRYHLHIFGVQTFLHYRWRDASRRQDSGRWLTVLERYTPLVLEHFGRLHEKAESYLDDLSKRSQDREEFKDHWKKVLFNCKDVISNLLQDDTHDLIEL